MKFAIISVILFSYIFAVPPSSAWDLLSKMKFKIEFNEEIDDVVFVPNPTRVIKKMIGKSITIKGYQSILLDSENDNPEQNVLLLCRYEDQNFTCIVPGAESYIEIICNEKRSFKEGVLYTFEGEFALNTKDFSRLPFQLKKAKCKSCDKE